MRRAAVVLLASLSLALLLAPRRAHAGGFYLLDRGTRPLGRGGAFVAGANGIDSLWYNPAGLKGAGKSLHFDATETFFRASYRRVDDGDHAKPTVDLSTPGLGPKLAVPVPTMGITHDFGLRDFTFAAGLFAPNAQAYRWPKSVDGMPAPTRYSLLSTEKSIIVHLALGMAWHGVKGLSLGISPQLVTGRFRTETVLSACSGVECGFAEDPEYDAPSVVDLNPFFAFTLGLGATYEIGMIKLGGSFNSGYSIGGEAKLSVKLPDSPIFDKAKVEGNKVRMDVPFPWIFRLGVEVNPLEPLRVELATVIERWSAQDEIRVKPKNVTMRNVLGIGDYEVGDLVIPRGMNDTVSLRLGGEYRVQDSGLTLRGGAAYENGAFRNKVLTPLTLDSTKLVVGLGLGWQATERLVIDLVYGHAFIENRNVTNSSVTQPVAIRPAPKTATHIANGRYTMEADFVGLGGTLAF